MKNFLRKFICSNRGVGMLEAAMAMPFFIIAIFGAINVYWLCYSWAIVQAVTSETVYSVNAGNTGIGTTQSPGYSVSPTYITYLLQESTKKRLSEFGIKGTIAPTITISRVNANSNFRLDEYNPGNSGDWVSIKVQQPVSLLLNVVPGLTNITVEGYAIGRNELFNARN
ncbi:MAG: hypothetical protein IT292_08215 [Deltaproteobacteria bacterium]|nr:hypothetical protein [Deltaproteobacteria bacterium]